jgi:hypothetical protein
MSAGYPDGVTAADIDALSGPEPARGPDPDAWKGYPELWRAHDRRYAIGARSALMRDAAWDEVVAEPPALECRYGGWHMAADPVGEALAELQHTDRALRLLVRAAATIEPAEREALLASALDAARGIAISIVRQRSWDMAEAAMDAEAAL